jgi:hypothetical protein
MRTFVNLFAAVVCVGIAGPVLAQEAVHAIAGTVTSVDPTNKVIHIKTEDGSERMFNFAGKPGAVTFEKTVKDGTVPAASFTKTNTQVVVYYVGFDTIPTLVAVQDLGEAPLDKTVGAVVKFDKHDHTLTVKDAAGAEKKFTIDPKTVSETSNGVGMCEKSTLRTGSQVRVVATQDKALFVRALTL